MTRTGAPQALGASSFVCALLAAVASACINSDAARALLAGKASCAEAYVFSSVYSNAWLICWQAVEKLVLGCIEADFCKEILV